LSPQIKPGQARLRTEALVSAGSPVAIGIVAQRSPGAGDRRDHLVAVAPVCEALAVDMKALVSAHAA
jgi:hypothetical protein